ncbi:MAG: hypothetical protein GY862_00165 [Gammaproteobacteria bacterium]|nr:hypothetical protein [Gammaproteobacteria bacterium]
MSKRMAIFEIELGSLACSSGGISNRVRMVGATCFSAAKHGAACQWGAHIEGVYGITYHFPDDSDLCDIIVERKF